MSDFYGWQQIVDELETAVEAIAPGTKVFIKEKFGLMRIYTSGSEDLSVDDKVKINRLVSQAEAESEHTCEACGRPGKLRQGAWWKTLCDDHAVAYYGRGWRWWVEGFEADGVTAKLPPAK